jgi:hypothetical protein
MNYEPFIEKLMQHYTSSRYLSEVAAAKEEFFDRAGTFDEASLDFELKMAQFTDWFLFVRKLRDHGKAPVEVALEDPEFKAFEADKDAFLNIRNSRRSLFEFQKVKKEDVYIRDLFTGFKYIIRSSRVNQGFNTDELFEARLIPYDGGFVFSNSFCFHPNTVAKYILKEVKRVSKLPDEEQAAAREDLMSRLFRMKYRHEQYRHLDINEIYSNESRVRI